MCPACHHDRFHVRQEGASGRFQLLCADCGIVVLDDQPAIPGPAPRPTPLTPI